MARRLKQGEVRWADLPQPAGRRPVVVLTRSDGLRYLSNATVAPVTRTIREVETEVLLTEADGVPTACAVSLDNIQTIPQGRLDELITTLGQDRLQDLHRAVKAAFAMA